MRPLFASLLLAATISSAGTTALAQVHVPGDYATIQAAINSGNAVIYVGAGNWYETLSIDHTVTLLPDPPADARQPTPFPRVTGMSIVRNSTDYPAVTVRGFRGRLTLGGALPADAAKLAGDLKALTGAISVH